MTGKTGKPLAKTPARSKTQPVYDRIREILESARANVARSVNTTQVIANWLIGREIVEEEQRGEQRAGYGEALIRELSEQLTREFGKGYSKDNLFCFRRFYQGYPTFIDRKFDAVRQISEDIDTTADQSLIQNAPKADSWQPGKLNPNLSWIH